MQPNEQGQMKTACNALALMEAGMSGTAAQRMAKQWEDKCAEVVKFRRLVGEAADMLDGAQSGFISGSCSDIRFDSCRDALIAEIRAALSQDKNTG